MKQSVSLIILLLFVTLIFNGCDYHDESLSHNNQPPTNLIYYTIGTPDKDLNIVNQELNQLLKNKLNITIEYNKIPWGNYGDRLATMISSGTNFDIAFASTSTQGDFIGNAQKGAWLNLTPYLNTYGKEMYEAINPLYWEGIRVEKKIFGVPTNKEIAVPLMFMYPQSLIEKYDINTSNYKTLQSIEPLLQLISKNEPDYLGLQLDSSSINLFSMGGYEYVLSQNVPLMIKSTDTNLEVVNIFETPYCAELLSTLRKYYNAGYINKDAPLTDSGNLTPNKKVFLKISEGGPYSDVLWSNDRQYKVVTQQISDLVVTSQSTQGSIMVVNAKTKYPEKCVEFLNCLNTDRDVRNLINFGIKGTHYNLTENNQVNKISNNYAGVQYTQGNWFILNTVVGEPLDKWNEFTIFNNSAFKSEILGFTANTNTYKKEISEIQMVWEKYYPFLMTGSVDVDYFLPRFVSELKSAGIDDVKKIVQIQLNNWKSSNL